MGESSNHYRGLVLAAAVRIVLRDTRLARQHLKPLLHVSNGTFYRILRGQPVKQNSFARWLEQLAMIRHEWQARAPQND